MFTMFCRVVWIMMTATLASSCAHIGSVKPAATDIVNVTASAVLDQGSFVVDIFFRAGTPPLHLLLAAPSRRIKLAESILILDEQGKCKEVLRSDSPGGMLLHRQLLALEADPSASGEVKAICSMLDRLLSSPEMPWNEVRFNEKWF